MFYKGVIEEINKVVVSDPSYGKDVWCRYEREITGPRAPWRVQLAVNEVTDNYDGIICKGVDFALLLSSTSLSGNSCTLKEDGHSFSHFARLKMKETEIGMDTACVALGINEIADVINASSNEWQPSCSLKTLTDGLFGSVYEGSYNGGTHLLYVSGYLDEDAGYSVEDVVQYLTTAFKIKDLELVKDSVALEDRIADAKKQSEPLKKNNPVKEYDLEI